MSAMLIAACNGTRERFGFGPKYWRVTLKSWTTEFLGQAELVLGKEYENFVLADSSDPKNKSLYITPMAGFLLANLMDAVRKTRKGSWFCYDGLRFELKPQGGGDAVLRLDVSASGYNLSITIPSGPDWENVTKLQKATCMVLAHFPPREFPQVAPGSVAVVDMPPNNHTPAAVGTDPLYLPSNPDVWQAGDNWCGCTGQPSSPDTCSPQCDACLAKPWYLAAWQEYQRMGGSIPFFFPKDLCTWFGNFSVGQEYEGMEDDGFAEA